MRLHLPNAAYAERKSLILATTLDILATTLAQTVRQAYRTMRSQNKYGILFVQCIFPAAHSSELWLHETFRAKRLQLRFVLSVILI